MLTLLVIGSIVLMAVAIGGLIAIPIMLISSLIWLVMLPFKLLFKLIFGLGGMLLGMLVAPIAMVIVGVVLVGAVVVGILALLAPLLPIVLLAVFGWALYRLLAGRSGYSSASDFRS
jgi:hypothetical protein